MRRITDTASRQNVILVAAANDRGVPSYPASCETVISVAKHPVPDPLRFWSGAPEGPDFVAWGVDVPLHSTDGNWFLGNGSSLAAAHMSGLIAAVLGNSPGLNVWQMKAALRELSASGDQLTHDAHRITRQRARRG
jgi:subtilisin family serine protease